MTATTTMMIEKTEVTQEVASPGTCATFTVDQKSLVDALGTLAPAMGKRSTLPILSNVKFAAHAMTQQLQLEVTNLEVFAKLHFPAHIETSGTFTVDYKELLAVIKPLKKSMLTFTQQENSVLISGAGMTVTLPCIAATEFPYEPAATDISRQPEERIASVPVETFRTIINSVYPAAADDDSRPVFIGIHLRLEHDVFIAEAADQFRLHMIRETIPGTGTWNRSLLIDAKALFDVCKKLPKTGYVTLSSDNSAFATLTCGLLTVHFRIIEATYPRVEGIIPKDFECDTSVLVDAAAFKNALNAIVPIAKDSSNIVRLKLSDGKLIVQAKRDGMESPMCVDVDASVEGGDYETIFNYVYLLATLNVAPTSQVRFTFKSGKSARPARVTIDTIPGFVAVIMPMSTNK